MRSMVEGDLLPRPSPATPPPPSVVPLPMPRMGRQVGNTRLPSGFGPETSQGGPVKGFGYLISALSVLLLGMGLRYWSYRRDGV